jgi:methylmalonyl-CoA mutase cobalamin-binding subunit
VTPTELAPLIQVIVEAAPSARKAGVTSVKVGELAFTLAPHEPDAIPAAMSVEDKKVEEVERLRDQQRGKGVNDLDLYAAGEIPTRQRRNREEA